MTHTLRRAFPRCALTWQHDTCRLLAGCIGENTPAILVRYLDSSPKEAKYAQLQHFPSFGGNDPGLYCSPAEAVFSPLECFYAAPSVRCGRGYSGQRSILDSRNAMYRLRYTLFQFSPHHLCRLLRRVMLVGNLGGVSHHQCNRILVHPAFLFL